MAGLHSQLDSYTMDSIPERVIFGRSSAMQEVRESVRCAASASVPVLILGEPGTGKEVIAREIHRLSPFRSAPFVAFCGTDDLGKQVSQGQDGALAPWMPSLPPDNSGCTLFIDGVNELASTLQAKLLELFHDGSVSHTNRELNQPQNVRVICASSRDLEAEVKSGNFRLDLFYRINVVTISLPSLRNRKEDIPDLAEFFFDSLCRQRNSTCSRLPSQLVQRFCAHDWPGNIRELENCMKSYVDTNGEADVTEAFISKALRPAGRGKSPDHSTNPIPLKAYKKRLIEQAEKELILRVLHQHQWNRKETAKVLQVSYQTLLHKLKQVGLSRKRQPRSNAVDQPVQE
jgi:two-component system, NtrC family, response regulator AtoC